MEINKLYKLGEVSLFITCNCGMFTEKIYFFEPYIFNGK